MINNLIEILRTNKCEKFNILILQQLNYAPEVYTKILLYKNSHRLKNNISLNQFVMKACEAIDKEAYRR